MKPGSTRRCRCTLEAIATSLGTVADSDLLEKERQATTDEGDHDRMAHIVVPASAVTEALITGKPCTALCGKTWVPNRDPKRYPLCQTCKEIASSMGWTIPTG